MRRACPLSIQAYLGGLEEPRANPAARAEEPCANSVPGVGEPCANSAADPGQAWPAADPSELPVAVDGTPPSPERGHSEDVSTRTAAGVTESLSRRQGPCVSSDGAAAALAPGPANAARSGNADSAQCFGPGRRAWGGGRGSSRSAGASSRGRTAGTHRRHMGFETHVPSARRTLRRARVPPSAGGTCSRIAGRPTPGREPRGAHDGGVAGHARTPHPAGFKATPLRALVTRDSDACREPVTSPISLLGEPRTFKCDGPTFCAPRARLPERRPRNPRPGTACAG